MTEAIQTHALSKRFRRVPALRSLDLAVPFGAIYALVGPNGAGKTTLIKLLMNIVRATSGEATILGIPAPQISGRAFTDIGYMSENQELPEWMAVGQFLSYVAGFYPKWDKALEAELVRDFELPLDRKLKHLSRGMKMKAALASALAFHPKLIVLDEPFTGLDPLVRDQLIESLLERAAEATIFISSHDLAEIESFSSHVGYLEAGQLRFSEELSSLTERFREVEVVRDSPAPLPPSTPASWLHVTDTPVVVRFIETRFDSTATDSQVRNVFGRVRDVTFTPMSLRSIFLAIAKGQRGATR